MLESDTSKKLELIKLLKDLFIKDGYSNAFDTELRKLLTDLNPDDVPSNYTTFYSKHIKEENKELNDTKFNKDVLHQSKLLNYFNGDFAKTKIEKDLNNFLKKLKKTRITHCLKKT